MCMQYVPEELLPIYRDKLIPLADIITLISHDVIGTSCDVLLQGIDKKQDKFNRRCKKGCI